MSNMCFLDKSARFYLLIKYLWFLKYGPNVSCGFNFVIKNTAITIIKMIVHFSHKMTVTATLVSSTVIFVGGNLSLQCWNL